jgi:hypothetical protein
MVSFGVRRPGKKWDLGILDSEEQICLSNKIEENFEFFTRTLRENFKESYLPFESILRLQGVLHIQLIEFEEFCFLSNFTTNIIEEHLKKTNSGSEEH